MVKNKSTVKESLKNTAKKFDSSLDWVKEKKRLLAEIDNLQKQKSQEMFDGYKFRNQDLLTELLEVVDLLERALQFDSFSEETEKFLKGIKMIFNKFDKIMTNHGVKQAQVKVGDKYDPSLCQTVGSSWDQSYPEGVVLKVEQKGYLLHERVLWPVKVIVNQKLQEKVKGK